MSRTFCLSGVRLAALAAAAVWQSSATAQTIDLPLFSACTPVSQPELPPRWRAVGLMAPFTDGQLDVGEFVFDGSLRAMRATVYGLESGAVDLLITEQDTHQLTGPHRAPTGCKSLGKKFSPPAAQWLSEKSVCVGEASIVSTPVQWWKTPAADARTDWYWFKSGTRMPWRTLFAAPSSGPAIIGDYALNYFPTFEPLAQTNLSRLRDFCVAQRAKETSAAAGIAKSARDLMAIHNAAAEAERAERIQALVPGFSRQACSRMTPVQWPEQFVMTAIITPIRFNEVGPFPSILFYDWTGAEAQVARLFLPRERPPVLALLPVLQKGIGYHVQQTPSGGIACTPKYPGMVRPNWMGANKCQCRGVLDGNSALSPNEATQILACQIPEQQGRVMWNWYTALGRPVLFAEAGAQGDGLMLADYFHWLPGQKVPASEFNLPAQCLGPDNRVLAPSGGHADRFTKEAGANCSNCHTIPQ
ncbi:MAG: hypothetical protein WD871_08255 [Xanthobacteraceae bacterium]